MAPSELVSMGILMAALTVTGLPYIAGTVKIGIAFSIETIGWVTCCTRQGSVSVLQGEPEPCVDLEINAAFPE
jgi:hypothetical protein